MFKRIVSVCLVFLMALTPLTVSAEETQTGTYYKMDISKAPGEKPSSTMDFMVLGNNTYVNAEQFSQYLGYKYMQSYNECVMAKPEYNIIYTFEFDSKYVYIYIGGYSLEYFANFEATFVDGVAWIPFNFACALCNASTFVTNEGVAIIKPEASIFDVLSMTISGATRFGFNWSKEIGYSKARVIANTCTTAVVGFLDGMFDGSTWSSLGFNIHTGIYNDNIVRQVGDLFAMPSDLEVEAQHEINQGSYKFSDGMGSLAKISQISELGKAYSDGANGIAVLSEEISDIAAGESVKLYDQSKELFKVAVKDSSFIPEYNSVLNKADDMYHLSNVASDASKQMKKVKEVINAYEFADDVTALDALCWTVKVMSYMDSMSGRDETAIETLRKYSRNSEFDMSYPLYNYASDMNIDTDWFDASLEYMERELSTVIMDKIPIELVVGGLGAGLIIGYNVLKNVPYIKTSLNSMDNFEYAQCALDFQNDSYYMFESAVSECFKDDELNEKNLKDVCDYLYAYLKFSYVARTCADASLDSVNFSKSDKTKLRNEMTSKNETISEYIAVLSQSEEDTSAACYGFLPSECRDFKKAAKKAEPATSAFITTAGEKIGASSQVTVPDDSVDLTNAIPEEEVIALVKRTLCRGFNFIFEVEFFAQMFEFDISDTYKVIGYDGKATDTYVVDVYTDGSLSGTLFVTIDGKEVWMGEMQSDGEYLVYQIDMLHFSVPKLISYITETYNYMNQEQETESTQ